MPRGQIEIVYGIHPSPFGQCLIGLTKRAMCHLSFLDTDNERKARQSIQETWPSAALTRNNARTRPYLKQLFGVRKKKQPIPLLLKGTNFQMKVWRALLAIPEGNTVSYANIARRIGSPKATRAVGTACGRNPIGFIIPCHRVLTTQGKPGGYQWGRQRKKAMLAWEAARVE